MRETGLTVLLFAIASLPFITGLALTFPVVLVATVLIALQLLRQNDYRLDVSFLCLGGFGLIALVLVAHGIVALESTLLVRSAVYLWIGFLGLILLPGTLPTATIIHSLLVYSGGLAVLEFAALVFPGGYLADFPVLGVKAQPVGLMITGNPNTFGLLCAIAAIGYLSSIRDLERLSMQMLGGLVLLGAVFSQSRSAWIAILLAGGLVAAYETVGRRSMSAALFVGGATAIVVSVGVLVANPGLFLGLTSRPILWEAAVEATVAQPTGYGLRSAGKVMAEFVGVAEYAGKSPHNSFLRVFVAGGLVGGAAYLILSFLSLRRGFVTAIDSRTLTPFALSLGALVLQLFEAMAIFGISTKPIVIAAAMGIAFQSHTGAIGPGESRALGLLATVDEELTRAWATSSVGVMTETAQVAWTQSAVRKLWLGGADTQN